MMEILNLLERIYKRIKAQLFFTLFCKSIVESYDVVWIYGLQRFYIDCVADGLSYVRNQVPDGDRDDKIVFLHETYNFVTGLYNGYKLDFVRFCLDDFTSEIGIHSAKLRIAFELFLKNEAEKLFPPLPCIKEFSDHYACEDRQRRNDVRKGIHDYNLIRSSKRRQGFSLWRCL